MRSSSHSSSLHKINFIFILFIYIYIPNAVDDKTIYAYNNRSDPASPGPNVLLRLYYRHIDVISFERLKHTFE